MFITEQIQEISKSYLKKVLREAPGALLLVLEEQKFNQFSRAMSTKLNEVDLYVTLRGIPRWNWQDFVEKASVIYARKVLTAAEHQVMSKDAI